MLDQAPTPSSSTQTQTWAAILTAIAGAAGLLLKRRFNRRPSQHSARPDLITRAEFHQSLGALRDKLDANQKEVLTAVAAHGSAVEKRLDALESAVARLDERTKNSAAAPEPKP